jgi:ribonuclease HI
MRKRKLRRHRFRLRIDAQTYAITKKCLNQKAIRNPIKSFCRDRLQKIGLSKLKVTVFSDGGARGNPGPAALAYIILDEKGKTLKTHSLYLGIRTNNQAEYEALITALESAQNLGVKEITCFLDSELVGNQLTGKYQVKNTQLQKLHQKVIVLRSCFRKICFVIVPRTNSYIEQADKMLNEKLDQIAKSNALS